MIDYSEIITKRREFLERCLDDLRVQTARYTRELEAINSAEDTLRAEERACRCKRCGGSGLCFGDGEKEGSVTPKECGCCDGTGYIWETEAR